MPKRSRTSHIRAYWPDLITIYTLCFSANKRSGGSLVGIGLVIVIAVNLVFEYPLNRFSGMAFIALFFPVVALMGRPRCEKTNR